MRKYRLYLIEDEFASHYFGREKMFFELFKEYEQKNGEMRIILKKQIDYITKQLPALRLHQLIQKKLGTVRGFKAENGAYSIELNGNLSIATMEVMDDLISVEGFGSYEAETFFFEVLRKCESSFLAVDLENNRYGWLKPIKERKFV